MRFSAVVIATQSNTQTDKECNVLETIDDTPIVSRSVSLFLSMLDCASVVLVVPKGQLDAFKASLGENLLMEAGPRLLFCESDGCGATSVKESLLVLRADDPELVIIHYANRPFVSLDLVNSILKCASETGACVSGIKPKSACKIIEKDGTIEKHLKTCNVRLIQYPQAYFYRGILSAYMSLGTDILNMDDDSSIWASAGGSIVCIPGEESNIELYNK